MLLTVLLLLLLLLLVQLGLHAQYIIGSSYALVMDDLLLLLDAMPWPVQCSAGCRVHAHTVANPATATPAVAAGCVCRFCLCLEPHQY
jgi:hypothetical protein